MKRFIYLFSFAFILFSSCKKEEAIDGNSFDVLSEYLVDNNLDIPNVLTSWIVAAPASTADVPTFIANYDIIDLRAADAYNAGHIEGAVNTTLTNLLTTAASTTKQILVVCYTGQTASHAVVALRLSGYSNAVVLKWGMSGWNSNFDSWSASCSSDALTSDNWETTPSLATTGSFDYPTFESTYTTGADILRERVEKLLAGGFKGIASADVLANTSNYFINNYWTATDVEAHGHITGAYRINPLTIVNDEIKGLDPSKTIVTYCWTGQTSSMVTAYLNVIGYNAVSLKFGTNSMIWSDLGGHQFITPSVDLPVVTN